MKLGATTILHKPLDSVRLEVLVKQALDDRRLIDEIDALKHDLQKPYAFHSLLGRSPRMRRCSIGWPGSRCRRATCLVTGETGTGKELVAQAIHFSDMTRQGPLVAVNCAALPELLLESELFGHERGAFTGADRQKKGRFELATGRYPLAGRNRGGPAGNASQAAPRFAGRASSSGSEAGVIQADCRVIVSTNLDLAKAVAAGRFREDLVLPPQCLDDRAPTPARPARRYPSAGRSLPRSCASEGCRKRPCRARRSLGYPDTTGRGTSASSNT